MNEQQISLKQLAKEVGVHQTTTWRWSDIGCKGITLETIAVGGRLRTSREAYERFLGRLNGEAVVTQDRSLAIRAAVVKAAKLGA